MWAGFTGFTGLAIEITISLILILKNPVSPVRLFDGSGLVKKDKP
jgi:hypothetical protein